MSSNNKLYRNFIILQEDERGYSNSNDKTLSGYSKIEAKGDKCKVSYYAQNLRTDDCKYYMVLICNKKDAKKIINLGELDVNSDGKGEATREYLSDSIGNLNISYDKICGAAIMTAKEGIPVYILCGFLNGDMPSDNWRNYQVVRVGTQSGEEKQYKKASKKETKKEIKKKDIREEDINENNIKEEHISEDIVLEKKEEREEKIDTKEEVKTSQETQDRVDEVEEVENLQEAQDRVDVEEVESEYAEKDEITEEEINAPLRSKSVFDEYEDMIEESKEAEEYELRGNSGSFFNSLVRGFDKYDASIDDIKNCKWHKVNVKDLYQMCNTSDYNKYTIVYYPMINYYPYIKKYGHFMIGLKGDKDGNMKYIVYGIPGDKDIDDQPYEGKTGFVTWVKDSKGNGYWLMFYDYKNSTVVVPME